MTLGLKFPHAVGASDGGAADETRDLFGTAEGESQTPEGDGEATVDEPVDVSTKVGTPQMEKDSAQVDDEHT
eukprot:CAMPEP_0181254120 /NCGR_PEP_ID=MMETSP1096-20121128/48426_1 /TAXON_ID=156174 ORGANISM="Chrysochromulina ericina, Strain CCMP281" /NCGR_SAMPLE_ID=MMETSP1096 /ASSEMBLY_ACC=CAM_ASM_000453 /LENGTH=71 /DNA_ID=CAMNT_0023352119 /DNA_START=488 /DNA_END=704 /DNA_ORIENTATION=+